MDGSGALPDEPVIRIVVPGPPRGWQRGGHKIITPKDKTKKAFVSTFTRDATRSEQGAIRMFAEQAMAGQAPFQGAVDMRYGAFFEIPPSWSAVKQRRAAAGMILPTVRPDFDNLMKQVDALKGIVWRDDVQATDVHFWKRYAAHPRVVMEIRLISPERLRREAAALASAAGLTEGWFG